MKRILPYFIAFCLMIAIWSHAQQAEAQTFKDVKRNAEYYEAVENLVKNGSLTKATYFNPNKSVTRGQLSKMLAITLKLDTKNVKNPKFKDVPTNHQFYPYIAALAQAGMISGYSDGTFGVNKPVTRGQMAKMLVKGFDLPKTKYAYQYFADEKNTETFDYAYTLLFFDITTAYEFKPSQSVKRSQVALFINRAINAKTKFAKDVRISSDVLDSGIDNSRLHMNYFSSNEEVAEVYANLLKDEIIIRPISSGKSSYFQLGVKGEPALQIDVAKNLSVTYKRVTELDTDYKLRLSYFIEDKGKNIAVSYEAETINLTKNKKASAKYDSKNPDYLFLEAQNPGEIWRINITYKDGSKQQKYVVALETSTIITLEEVILGTNNSVEDADLNELATELLKEYKKAVIYDEQGNEATPPYIFTEPGTYRYIINLGEPIDEEDEMPYDSFEYTVVVLNIDGKLSYASSLELLALKK